jgi:hypothetical protein
MSRFVLTAQLQLQAPNNVAQVVKQIQSQLNNVQVNVQVQGASKAQQQVQQLTAQTNKATTAAERMGKAFAIERCDGLANSNGYGSQALEACCLLKHVGFQRKLFEQDTLGMY